MSPKDPYGGNAKYMRNSPANPRITPPGGPAFEQRTANGPPVRGAPLAGIKDKAASNGNLLRITFKGRLSLRFIVAATGGSCTLRLDSGAQEETLQMPAKLPTVAGFSEVIPVVESADNPVYINGIDHLDFLRRVPMSLSIQGPRTSSKTRR